MKEYRATLVHSDIVLTNDLSANILWLETFIKTLDNMDAHLHRFRLHKLLFSVLSSRFYMTVN